MRIIFKLAALAAEIAFLITVGKKYESTNPRAKEIDIKMQIIIIIIIGAGSAIGS